MTDPTRRAEARVTTENASKYLQQLCKHFQHKLPATFDPAAGAITFPMGEVKLAAEPEALALALESPGADELEKLKDVVARHLVRFAFREELNVAWRDAA
jgi:hypothetical protein